MYCVSDSSYCWSVKPDELTLALCCDLMVLSVIIVLVHRPAVLLLDPAPMLLILRLSLMSCWYMPMLRKRLLGLLWRTRGRRLGRRLGAILRRVLTS